MAVEREWGAWTEIKLDALRLYLRGFTQASRKARRTMYLDLMAGSTRNYARHEHRPFDGSALVALKTRPRLTRVVLCEKDPQAAEDLETGLRQQFPGRDLVVLRGDCNTEVPAYLARLRQEDPGWRLAPSFALIDQFAAEVRWETIEALARFRTPPPGRQPLKTELWLYHGDTFIPRGAWGDGEEFALPGFASRVDALYGTDQWQELHRRRKASQITGQEYATGLVNFMRWRLENDLGYRVTVPLKIRSDRGQRLYTMIFATDHDAGESIMRYVSREADQRLAEMVRQRRARDKDRRPGPGGTEPMFSLEDPAYSGLVTVDITQDEALTRPADRPDWLG